MNLVKMRDDVVYEFGDHGHLVSKRSAIAQDGTVLWNERSQGSFAEWLKTYQSSCKPALVDGWWVNPASIATASEELLMRIPGELTSVKVSYLPLSKVQPFRWAPPDWDGTGPPLKFRDLSQPESYQLIAVGVCKRRLREIKGGAQKNARYIAETEIHEIDEKAKVEKGDLTLKLHSHLTDFTVGSPGDSIFDPLPENL